MSAVEHGVDPIRLEVMRSGFSAAADEMGIALQRAAYSTNIKTRLDFSCALFDRDARVVAQSFSQPIHLGSLVHFVPRILETYGVERLRPGDALICNDGHLGGVHLNDVCLVAPHFHDGERVAFCAALAHHVDVGGGTPGSLTGLSREVFGEGIRIPPVRLLEGGRLVPDVFGLIMNNIRAPRESGGDLRAQIAAVNVGARRFQEILDRYGLGVVEEAIDQLLDYTERRTREEIRGIPEGRYRAVGVMDDDGVTDVPVEIAVAIDVRADAVVFDLDGSDAQRPGPINATYAMTLSNCAYALRALMAADLPVNDGFYRALEVHAPAGSVVNAQPPAPIGGGWETGFRVCETALQALAGAVPERLAAGSKGCLCNIAFGGDGRDGERFVFYEAVGGGYGARAAKDGIDAVQPHGQNTESSPIEETEANYPVRIVRYELVPDSGGPGRLRGGLGLRRDYQFERGATFSVLSDRAKRGPWGLEGAPEAAPARYVLNPDTRGERALPSKTSVVLTPTDVVSIRMAGGGGYGPPGERDLERVAADLASGRVTPAQARAAYGVAVRDDGTIDPEATAALRARGDR